MTWGHVEFSGKVAFSSPCIEKSDVLGLSPLREFVYLYRKFYLQKFSLIYL